MCSASNRSAYRFLSIAAAGIILLISADPVTAQQERLTLDWVFSEEGKTATSTPDHTWLENGLVLLYDRRPPKSERTLETFDPDSGRRRRLFDPDELLAEFDALLEPEEPVEELGWPDAVHPQGEWFAWEKEDDLLLVGARSADITRIGSPDTTEKSARFSPDGSSLAFIRDHDLFVFDLEDQSEKRLTSDGSETLLNGTLSWVYWEELFNRVDRGYVWSPDSASIAFMQTDESGVGVMHYVDVEPYLPYVIRQRHAKAGSANPRVRAGVVSVADAETTWIDLGSYLYEYLVRIKWLPDSRRIAVQTLNRPQTKLDLFVADAATGAARHVMREHNDGWVNVHDDLHFIDGGDEFLWVSERDGYAHVYRFDLDGQLIRQVTRGKWSLRPSGGAAGMDQAVAHIDEQEARVYFMALEKDSTERHLYRVDFDGSDLQRVTTSDGTHRILFSPDGEFFIDAASAIDRPPSLAVHAIPGHLTAEITSPATDVAARFELRDWEMFTVETRDGFEMPAMMLRPRNFDPARSYPAVVFVYGGPSAPTVTNAWHGGGRGLYHQLLADEGIVVFYVDNRSTAGRSKTDANTIVRQLYGPVELDDLLDGVAWLKSQPFIDAGRVGIWGWSGGGAMTLSSMTGSGEFAAGVAVAPVTDWRHYDTIYTERYLKRPQDNEDGYESTSLVNRARDLHGRLLLMHGTYDDNVHPQNSWAFANELIDAGITFDMMIYPMRKHGISDDEAQLHIHRTMLEFWRREFGLGD